jgi:hypothetical protein
VIIQPLHLAEVTKYHVFEKICKEFPKSNGAEGDSKVVWFEGHYSDYEEDRKLRLEEDADQPHRIKSHSMTRA